MKVLLIIFLFTLASCGLDKKKGELKIQREVVDIQGQTPSVEETNFRIVKYDEVEIVLNRYGCSNCHFEFESEAETLKSGYVNFKKPEFSRLYLEVKNQRMPEGGPYLVEDELKLILDYMKTLASREKK